MAVLLIWEEIPDSTKVYKLEGELAKLAKAAHGQIINTGDEVDAASALNIALDEAKVQPIWASDEPGKRVAGPKKMDGVTAMYFSGFAM